MLEPEGHLNVILYTLYFIRHKGELSDPGCYLILRRSLYRVKLLLSQCSAVLVLHTYILHAACAVCFLLCTVYSVLRTFELVLQV